MASKIRNGAELKWGKKQIDGWSKILETAKSCSRISKAYRWYSPINARTFIPNLSIKGSGSACKLLSAKEFMPNWEGGISRISQCYLASATVPPHHTSYTLFWFTYLTIIVLLIVIFCLHFPFKRCMYPVVTPKVFNKLPLITKITCRWVSVGKIWSRP